MTAPRSTLERVHIVKVIVTRNIVIRITSVVTLTRQTLENCPRSTAQKRQNKSSMENGELDKTGYKSTTNSGTTQHGMMHSHTKSTSTLGGVLRKRGVMIVRNVTARNGICVKT